MFENAGGKLKVLALINFWIIVIASIIIGFKLGSYFILLIPIIGIILGWLSSILFYAFGELCENVYMIANRTPNTVSSSPNQSLHNSSYRSSSSIKPNTCPSCGYVNNADSKFCVRCGKAFNNSETGMDFNGISASLNARAQLLKNAENNTYSGDLNERVVCPKCNVKAYIPAKDKCVCCGFTTKSEPITNSNSENNNSAINSEAKKTISREEQEINKEFGQKCPKCGKGFFNQYGVCMKCGYEKDDDE